MHEGITVQQGVLLGTSEMRTLIQNCGQITTLTTSGGQRQSEGFWKWHPAAGTTQEKTINCRRQRQEDAEAR